MKVLLDCSNIRTGGALQNALAFLCFAKQSSRYQWHVALSYELSLQVPDDWEKDFSSCIRFGITKGNISKLLNVKVMCSVEQRISPDIVFSLFGPAYWRSRAPHIVGFAKPQYLYPEIDIYRVLPLRKRMFVKFMSKIKLLIQKRFFLNADYLVGETETVKKRACEALGFSKDYFFVVRNSYSTLFQQTSRQYPPVIDKQSGKFIILVPSAWYPHKNLEIVPFVAVLLQKKTDLDFIFRFTIPESSNQWYALRERAKSLRVVDRLETLGQIRHADFAKQYHDSNVVFLPTLLECSTAVYPEAMATSVPIITSDFDFARELCGKAALFFNPFSPEEGAKCLFEIITNPELCQSLKNAGKCQLHDCFPNPEEKFEDQLHIIQIIAEREGITN